MKTKEEKLVTIKTYADQKKCSVTWVYRLAERGDIKIKEIDGVKFVVL